MFWPEGFPRRYGEGKRRVPVLSVVPARRWPGMLRMGHPVFIGLSYMWLFHLHSTLKRQPFYPVFPLAESMAEAFGWLSLWSFKEKRISRFLWHGLLYQAPLWKGFQLLPYLVGIIFLLCAASAGRGPSACAAYAFFPEEQGGGYDRQTRGPYPAQFREHDGKPPFRQERLEAER